MKRDDQVTRVLCGNIFVHVLLWLSGYQALGALAAEALCDLGLGVRRLSNLSQPSSQPSLQVCNYRWISNQRIGKRSSFDEDALQP